MEAFWKLQYCVQCFLSKFDLRSQYIEALGTGSFIFNNLNAQQENSHACVPLQKPNFMNIQFYPRSLEIWETLVIKL